MVSLHEFLPHISEPFHHEISSALYHDTLRRAEQSSPPAPESKCDVASRRTVMHAY